MMDSSSSETETIPYDSQTDDNSSQNGIEVIETGTHSQTTENQISPGKDYIRVSEDLNFSKDKGCEHLFWRHKKGGRTHIQCGHHITTNNGTVIWCTYDQRIDHHRHCEGKHVHKFPTVHQKTIESYTRAKHVTRCNDIYTRIAHFAALSNLSLEMAASKYLFDIIYAAINYYKENSAQFLGQPPSKIIPKTSANTIRTLMIDSADSILKKKY